MTVSIKSSDLDFNSIKSNLKSYLKEKDAFKDYNFEGSALNNILDVLAYNTHMNGLIANFSINESFLNTAQLRSSVVSLSEAVGYVPRSVTSSKASVNLSINITDPSRPSQIEMPIGTKFNTQVNGVNYVFRTLEKFTATPDTNGLYEFKITDGSTNISISEGIEKDKTFYVGELIESQVYVIPDPTIDTSSLTVKVYPLSSSPEQDAVSYTNINLANRISETSTHYQIKEVPNGTYELLFGDGLTTGKRPVSGNKILVTYLSSKGPVANGATLFQPQTTLNVPSFGNYTINVATNAESAGGSLKESIESIRQNAPIAFSSQQRLVTAEDYTAQVMSRHGNVLDDVVSWGGADNVPAVYGTVYIGLKFKTGVSVETQQQTKDDIVTLLTDNFGIMSIETRFSETANTYIELKSEFNFDPDLTASTAKATQNAVIEKMNSHFIDNLNKFGKVFRRSLLLAEIDDMDVAILNSKIDVKCQQRQSIITNKSLAYNYNFPMAIAVPDDVNYIVTSEKFYVGGVSCYLRNKLNTTQLEIVSTNEDIIVDNAGSYSTGGGTVNIVGLNPQSIEGGGDLKVSVIPANQAVVKPLRNYVLTFDESRSNAVAIIDYQDTAVSLT